MNVTTFQESEIITLPKMNKTAICFNFTFLEYSLTNFFQENATQTKTTKNNNTQRTTNTRARLNTCDTFCISQDSIISL
jgi:hypothetical protein